MRDELGCLDHFKANGKEYGFYSLPKLAEQHEQVKKLPYSLRILLENLMRFEDGSNITVDDVAALAEWDPKSEPSREISFTPARVVLQDFTGVPAIVDLAAMREAMKSLGGKADRINPLSPAELVIDHSIQVDSYGQADSLDVNNQIEFKRNKERYAFLRWGQGAFDNFKVVPPNTGIVHQVNLEHLSRVVFDGEVDGQPMAWPDTLVGTDSHTTMINGLGILGWGVGGIEAEAAMLGQPISMLIPQVIGFKLTGKLPEGTTATDLVLTITEMLREKGVVGKFVEFFGHGLSHLPLADRATIGNMSPEFGSTCAIFPIDEETIRYLELSGRSKERLELVETYARAQDFWRDDEDPDPVYSDVLELNLGDVVPSLAGPKRPQDRVLLSEAKDTFVHQLSDMTKSRDNERDCEMDRFAGEGGGTAVGAAEIPGAAEVEYKDQTFILKDGAVVIAAITSCTNTSNPAVMLGAGIMARNAREKGLNVKPWVKTSLAPGSKVVTDYLEKSGLDDDLEALGFYTVGYGCTTCIGNSGPLPEPVEEAIKEHEMVVCSVLSGNRNFEGRIHPEVKMNYLASPPLVVAYALAGRMDIDLVNEPLGEDPDGNPVYLKDIWPDAHEIQDFIQSNVTTEMFSKEYSHVFEGDELWKSMDTPTGEMFDWDEDSTYVRNPPFFEGMDMEPEPIGDITGARVLAKLGDSVTTDHISPAGAIKPDSPAGRYLQEKGIHPADFNSYGSRRGNHEVMMRGTFANVRIKNQVAPDTEGGFTTYFPDDEVMPIYDAAMKYQEDGTPLVVLAGKEYGSGSSRDWAAKGTRLLGVKAVIAASFERIHRSNLIGMGVLPLTFADGEDAESLGLDGTETFDITGLKDGTEKEVEVKATHPEGKETTFKARVRLDTPKEIEYYKNGGILHYVLRDMAKAA
ncbi:MULTISPECIES: aconitate hydratase AcnA [unclassified Wenzhouxiangella]|uniref:aconitate hydratase AcnA n=1 Tax=unclassified Wenzhouxiangella TaxID=2613841 RepID=UPI000E32B572|nr:MULTISPECIES: aconitate hydratase AcnA [unclassified Wenzhouxiangella]RFF27777.1 aconitate hydratase AcnA [Wenzhouxiangella sp. 15181]RFP68406.1 aconitate hydratase AcnA [Wenzhouxiangella sp. 15190]